MATIAQEVGYDSEAAFARAFKRLVGLQRGGARNARRTIEPIGAHLRAGTLATEPRWPGDWATGPTWFVPARSTSGSCSALHQVAVDKPPKV